MNFTIIASKKDKAGMNIIQQLKRISDLPTYYTKKEIICAENIDKEQNIEEEFIIFASKHASKQKIKTLSIHAPGNWGRADMGGKEKQICKTSSFFLKYLFQILNQEAEQAKLDYACTLEVTHHGPYVEKPCCFIEIGSSKEEWQDKNIGEIIAETIKKAVSSFDFKEARKKWKPAVGIGSPHYCPNFNKTQLNSEYALSHIIPQYVFPITEEMLKQAVDKTQEDVGIAILDWKGMRGQERQKAVKLLNKRNLKYLRTSEIN
jgi:D-aminoacyl-tRNA deacylase